MNTCAKVPGGGALSMPVERFQAGIQRATVGNAIRDIIYARILTLGLLLNRRAAIPGRESW